jgi:hypothetical protein
LRTSFCPPSSLSLPPAPPPGNFSDVACACECIAEFNPIQPGWCADPQTGACTVAKVYDTTSKTFGCPGGRSARVVVEGVGGGLPCRPAAAASFLTRLACCRPHQGLQVPAPRVSTTPPPPLATPLHAGASVREPPKAADTAPQQDPATANCGHTLQDFVGLGLSGTQDNSVLYSQALRAVDGLCDTCAEARDPSGNYFSLVLPVSWGCACAAAAPPAGGRPPDAILAGWCSPRAGLACCSTARLGLAGASMPLPRRPLSPCPHPPPPLCVQERSSVTSVQLTVGESVEGAFLFVGDASSNNGLDNPVCAMVRRRRGVRRGHPHGPHPADLLGTGPSACPRCTPGAA